MSESNDRLFTSIYKNLDNPASYSGVKRLFDKARSRNPNIKLNDVKKWLSGQNTYTLHRQARKKFLRERVHVYFIDENWEADLCDLTPMQKRNKGYKFLLTCIDVLSKYAWAVPLKDKSTKNVCDAFSHILSTSKRKPDKLRTDKGKEFVNKEFKNLLKERGIVFFTSQNEDIKCPVVERFNRTLKNKMFRYFTEKRTNTWINVLDKLVSNYNNTVHRSIKEKPVNVTFQNERAVYNTLYPEMRSKTRKPTYKIGDHVRISKFKQKFAKGYTPQWTEEVFVISKVIRRKTLPVYCLRDLHGQDIHGTFYEVEIQRVQKPTNDE